MKKIIISERQLPLLKKVLKERRKLLMENNLVGERKSKIVIISERQVPLLENVLWEKRLDEALKNHAYTMTGENYYLFEPIGNALPTEIASLDPQPTTDSIIPLAKNNQILWYKQVSKKGKKKPSQYYQSIPQGGTKRVIRGSDHWSYYVIPNYTIQPDPNDYAATFFNKQDNVTLVLKDVGDVINPHKDRSYAIKLNHEYTKCIPQEVVRHAYKDKNNIKYNSVSGQKHVEIPVPPNFQKLGIYKNFIYAQTEIDGSENIIDIPQGNSPIRSKN